MYAFIKHKHTHTIEWCHHFVALLSLHTDIGCIIIMQLRKFLCVFVIILKTEMNVTDDKMIKDNDTAEDDGGRESDKKKNVYWNTSFM